MITLDLDGVIYDFVGELLEQLRNKHGISKNRSSIYDYNIAKSLNIDSSIIQSIVNDNATYTKRDKIYAHAIPFVNFIRRSHRVIILTSRPECVKETTLSFLSDNKIYYDDIYFGNKSSVIEKLRPDIVVEDDPNIAILASRFAKIVFLVVAKYNKDIFGENIFHIRSLGNIVNYIKTGYYDV
ncbi:MAG: hypothetical protein HPY87_08985 [Fervidobacterium sp.]|uniref:hypothetical protein n=1 Tax=Fervidobacterium sp. TaxID=1871331 RepID=UPI0025C5317F|nr:hypothetical protein [Fervidobacterium sp.]NPU89995.1 hypothetical protein [Fervidobacterium sp.]